MKTRLSKLAQQARTSPIRSMTVECARVGGVNLAQGVCDTPVPEEVRKAAQQAIEAGHNTYSRYDGHPELRHALSAKMKRHNGLDYDPEGEIVVTSGGTGAFYVAALALLERGDEVIVFEPFYGYHVNTLAAQGIEARIVTLSPPDWSVPIETVEAAITDRTRAMIINTPVNPSGKVMTEAELTALGELAQRHDLFIFTDEVYEHFVFDGRKHLSPGAIPGLRDRTITINALSKTFAITGWRIGWVAADARFAEAFGQLNDLVYVCPPSPLQLGAAAGLETLGEDYYANIAIEYEQKRDQLCDALENAGLPPVRPEGSYFALADISRLPGRNSDERAMHLLHEAGVASVPGSAFYRGEEGDSLSRFCFGKTDEDLDEACRRLKSL